MLWFAASLLLPLAVFSSTELLTCPPVASLTFDLSFRVRNLDGDDNGLDEAAVALLRDPFIVLSGNEVAVVLREVAPRSFHLLGVYYCGQYRVVPSAPAVAFSPTATNPATGLFELLPEADTAMLRGLVAAHTTDDLLTEVVAPRPDVASLLAFSVTHERRSAIDRHLRHRPRAQFESEGDYILCGESRLFPAYSQVRMLGQPDVVPTVTQLNNFDIVGLCFVLPEVLSRVHSRDMILRRDGGAGVFLEDQDDVTMNCPGTAPYGEGKQVSSTHDTPRGMQLKEAVRADLQRAALGRFTELPSVSFAAFCADRDGVPSWISGRTPGVDRVQTVADRDWARLVVQTLPNVPVTSGPTNSAALQWLRQPSTATPTATTTATTTGQPWSPVATVTDAAAAGQCVPVEALQFQSVWSVLNSLMYEPEAEALGGRHYSHVVSGVDVGLLFRSAASGSNAQLVGVWYCGRFFEANEVEEGVTLLDLPDFLEMNAFVVKKELKDTFLSMVGRTVVERPSHDTRVRNYLRHKETSTPLFALQEVRGEGAGVQRRIQSYDSSVMCNDYFIAYAQDVFLAKRLKPSDIDLHAFCALMADMVFFRPSQNPDVHTIRYSVNAAAVAAVPEGGRVTYSVTCPGYNAPLVPENSPRMAQISDILANNGQVFFVHMCQDEFGIPSWLVPGSSGPAPGMYARTKADADSELHGPAELLPGGIHDFPAEPRVEVPLVATADWPVESPLHMQRAIYAWGMLGLILALVISYSAFSQ